MKGASAKKGKERSYWLGFNVFIGIGPKRFAVLKNYFGSAQKAWKASKAELLKVGLPKNLVASFLKFRKS